MAYTVDRRSFLRTTVRTAAGVVVLGSASSLLAEILRQGRSQEIANFLNRNTNTGIERRALALIRPLAAEEPRVAAALQGSLDPRLLEALGLVPLPPPASPPPRRARLSLTYPGRTLQVT